MSGDISSILLIGLAVLAIVAFVVIAQQIQRKHQEALAREAARLGLSFTPSRSSELARRHENLRGLGEGDDRYAFDIMEGDYLGHAVTVFDFHYETHSTDSQGRRQTSHHHRHVVLLHLEREFPAMFVAPEGILSKIAQAFGYDDIDFESHEFSSRFCVRSADKKFAYDVCNPAMMDFLLGNLRLSFELRGSVLALVFEGSVRPEEIEPRLRIAHAIRERMPDYLFTV